MNLFYQEDIDLYYELDPGKHMWVDHSEIEDGIYLGGVYRPTSDLEGRQSMDPFKAPHSVISKRDVKLVISFTDEEVMWNFSDDVYPVHFILEDQPYSDIKQCFYIGIQRILKARKSGKNVFVHCLAGISRSVTLLCAYYLYVGIPDNTRPTVKEVVQYIQSKRPFVRPNPGFLYQLRQFYDEVPYLKL
jgi:hypothetical protein